VDLRFFAEGDFQWDLFAATAADLVGSKSEEQEGTEEDGKHGFNQVRG
jgi:hypothetical protein